MEEIKTTKVSYYKVASKYKIPPSTLRDYVTSGTNVRILGRPRVLSGTQEKDLVERIKKSAKIGIPLKKTIQREAYLFCEEHGIKHRFNVKKSTAGKKWLQDFLVRNKHILNVGDKK